MKEQDINRALIVRMHDAYMQEYKKEIKWWKEWRKINAKNPHWVNESNARLSQGKASALIRVINDLRYILRRKPIGLDSEAYGYIFDLE